MFVRLLTAITEHEVVAHFLRTEIDSVRFRQRLLELLQRDGRDPRIIEHPDIGDAEENVYRAHLLGDYRGYGRYEGIFKFVPDDLDWHRCVLSREDLARVRYVDYSYWNEISGGSGRPVDAARCIRAGIEVFGQSTQGYLDLAREVEQGAVFPEIILLGRDTDSELVVLEGHVRITAYCLAAEHLPGHEATTSLAAIAGFSSHPDLAKF